MILRTATGPGACGCRSRVDNQVADILHICRESQLCEWYMGVSTCRYLGVCDRWPAAIQCCRVGAHPDLAHSRKYGSVIAMQTRTDAGSG